MSQEPGRRVVVLACLALVVVVGIDLLLTGGLSMFFDLCFVTVCVASALLVRRRDALTVALTPPALMIGALGLVGSVSPGLVADPGDGPVAAVIGGLATHAGALASGYAVCLVMLAVRLAARERVALR